MRMIRKIHQNNRNKTDTSLEGWGVGDTHFTSSHIGGIHISLGICVRGYTYHCDTGLTPGKIDAGINVGIAQTRFQGLPNLIPRLYQTVCTISVFPNFRRDRGRKETTRQC